MSLPRISRGLAVVVFGISLCLVARSADEPAQSDLEKELEKVLTIERDAEFDKAIALCAELKQRFASADRAQKLDEALQRLKREKHRAAGLSLAVRRLTSTDGGQVEHGKQLLLKADETGRIYLRKAVREGEPRLAVAAAQVLIDERDEQIVPLLMDWLRKTPEEPMLSTVVDGLSGLKDPGTLTAITKMLAEKPAKPQALLYLEILSKAGSADPKYLPDIFKTFRNGGDAVDTDLAGFFASLFCGKYGKNAQTFDKDAGTDSHQYLVSCVDKALSSKQPDVQMWALEHARQLDIIARGMRGSYYRSDKLDEMAFERLDIRIDFTAANIGWPDPPPKGIAARWSGSLVVPASGTCTFHVVTDGAARLFLGDQSVIDEWGDKDKKGKDKPRGREKRKVDKSATVELTQGLHDFKLEFRQLSGNAVVGLSWQPPTAGREVLSEKVVVTHTWPAMVRYVPPDRPKPDETKDGEKGKKPPKDKRKTPP